MFYHKEINTELLVLTFLVLLMMLIVAADQLLMPEIQPPQISIKVNF
ncbi:hypothetical protein [Persephonella sp.]